MLVYSKSTCLKIIIERRPILYKPKVMEASISMTPTFEILYLLSNRQLNSRHLTHY